MLQKPSTVQPTSQHWKKILLDTVKQFISFAPYMMIGVAVGALLHGYVPQDTFENLNEWSSGDLIWLVLEMQNELRYQEELKNE